MKNYYDPSEKALRDARTAKHRETMRKFHQLKDLSNAEYAKTNADFQKRCIAGGVDATKRQASKFRNKKGAAFRAKVSS